MFMIHGYVKLVHCLHGSHTKPIRAHKSRSMAGIEMCNVNKQTIHSQLEHISQGLWLVLNCAMSINKPYAAN